MPLRIRDRGPNLDCLSFLRSQRREILHYDFAQRTGTNKNEADKPLLRARGELYFIIVRF